jgi:hypothetical protein
VNRFSRQSNGASDLQKRLRPTISFGGGLVNWPHGFYVDRAGNVWVTDGQGDLLF